MGLIRKTVSIGTLGAVSFRSKKERLRRAERAQRVAESSLDAEHAARLSAEDRIGAAERRVKKAKADAASAAKQLERTKKRRTKKELTRRQRRRRAKQGDLAGDLRDVRADLEPIVRSGVENARRVSSDGTELGRRAGRRARKAAKRSVRRAHAGASAVKEAVQNNS